MGNRISRRSFLKKSAVALALAAADVSTISAATGSPSRKATVFFTNDISADGLLKIYSKISKTITGKTAIKIHSGEPNGPNILPRDMVKALQQHIADSALVETNTFYKGSRFTTADHRETLKLNGWDFCPVDILDEDGAVMIPIRGGRRFTGISVGKNLLNYKSMVILTHFKGHLMGGFGGSLKNIAIGLADGTTGKKMIHAAPDNDNYDAWLTGAPFQENMVEAAKAMIGQLRKQDRLHQCPPEHVGRLRLRGHQGRARQGSKPGHPGLRRSAGGRPGIHRHGLSAPGGRAPRPQGAHRIPQGSAPAVVHERVADGERSVPTDQGMIPNRPEPTKGEPRLCGFRGEVS